MPGLGDALRGSLGEVQSLVDRAAAGEGRTEGLSGGERQALLGSAAAGAPGNAGDRAPDRRPNEPSGQDVPGPAAEPADDGAEAPRFSAGGVIRRKLRAGGSGPGAAAPPPGEDLLADCRRVERLPRAADYRLAALVAGVEGLARALREGRAGGPAVLAVCGASERAGTSTLAMAAALRLAGDGARVLLVDADLRSARLAELLGATPAGPDLRAVLRGEAPLEAALVYAAADNLAVLPCRPAERGAHGQGRPDAPPPRAALDALLAACRAQFGFVILDAGSAADWDGAAAVAGAAGHAVLAVRAGRVTARTVAGLRRRLERAGARLDGAVLTFASEEGGGCIWRTGG
jgi:tyrosine-protein kinase Etk/Wzc